MVLNSHIPAYATCFARKVCGLVWSTWGTSVGGNKSGARDRILNTKVARRACAGQTFSPCSHLSSGKTALVNGWSHSVRPEPNRPLLSALPKEYVSLCLERKKVPRVHRAVHVFREGL